MDALAQVEDNLEHGDEKTRLCVVMYVTKYKIELLKIPGVIFGYFYCLLLIYPIKRVQL